MRVWACVCFSCVRLDAGAPLFDVDAPCTWEDCRESNHELLATIRECEHSYELHEIALSDSRMHRMSVPKLADQVDLDRVRLVPRFGVAQGVRENGTVKVRAVDNFSWSCSKGVKRRKRRDVKRDSINGQFGMEHCIRHDHLDMLLVAMRLCVELTGQAGFSCAAACGSVWLRLW